VGKQLECLECREVVRSRAKVGLREGVARGQVVVETKGKRGAYMQKLTSRRVRARRASQRGPGRWYCVITLEDGPNTGVYSTLFHNTRAQAAVL